MSVTQTVTKRIPMLDACSKCHIRVECRCYPNCNFCVLRQEMEEGDKWQCFKCHKIWNNGPDKTDKDHVLTETSGSEDDRVARSVITRYKMCGNKKIMRIRKKKQVRFIILFPLLV